MPAKKSKTTESAEVTNVVVPKVVKPAVETPKQEKQESNEDCDAAAALKKSNTTKYNEIKKIAKTALALSGSCNPRAYSDLSSVAKSTDKDKLDKEIIGMVIILQQLVPGATQYNKDALLTMKCGTLRKTAKSLLSQLPSQEQETTSSAEEPSVAMEE